MAWVAVDKDYTEWIYDDKPWRENEDHWIDNSPWSTYIQLPQGTIKKLIGRELTWEDEPVELK